MTTRHSPTTRSRTSKTSPCRRLTTFLIWPIQSFRPIRAQLARAFMAYKSDLGVDFADDEAILQRVDTIAWMILDRMGKAFLAHDVA